MWERRERSAQPQELWVMAGKMPPATPEAFCQRVNKTLETMGFAGQVCEICGPACADPRQGGWPGIGPVGYLKMLTVGFFEDLPSERSLAGRCADSRSIRDCLGYRLTEATPDHSSLSGIRERGSIDQPEAIHRVLWGALRGRKLGLEIRVMEANASLRALEYRRWVVGRITECED